MKIERLLQIVIYLLNHGRVSGSSLATIFDVSLRTIQRDVDTITLAGIPIIAFIGVDGGYEIDPNYKLHLQIANDKDYTMILQSLYAYQTAFDNTEDFDTTIEKIQSLKKETDEFYISIDFSNASERPEVNESLKMISNAIQSKSCVSFYYVNAKGEASVKYVQPISIVFKWYSWYLIGFDTIKNERRMYKLVRMEELAYSDTQYIIDRIFIENHNQKERESYTIVLYATASVKTRLIEYLNARVTSEIDDGIFRMEARVAQNDIFWKGILISCGSNIKIVEPLELRDELLDMISEFYLQNYDKPLS